MPAGSRGMLNVPSVPVKVWLASRLVRLRAITRTLPTGRAALVTLPRTCTAAGSGRGDPENAGRARATIAVANAVAWTRRINYPPVAPASLWRGPPGVKRTKGDG